MQVFRAVVLWISAHGFRLVPHHDLVVNGEPKISWEPKLAANEKSRRCYTAIDQTNLADNGWTEVAHANRDGMRFLRVKVELP